MIQSQLEIALIHKIKTLLEKSKIQPQNLQNLPHIFIEFMKNRGIILEQLTIPIPRYIRLKPNLQITKIQLCQNLNIQQSQIQFIQDHFWALNPNIKINKCELYQKGLLYGMDYSSSIPVKCLNIQANMKILQICSAPGNKSMLMADKYQGIKIIGVQININRANIMKNLIQKYNLQNKIKVQIADGAKYYNQNLFDRVLIDAQCTHEGSLKHIYKFFNNNKQQTKKKQKQMTKQQIKQFKINNSNPYTSQITKNNQWTLQDFQSRFLDKYKLEQLQNLQYSLLQNGFKNLKNNGILVYSTCSFDYQQNQDIIQQFLSNQKNAKLMNAFEGLKTPIQLSQGKLQGTIRIYPSTSMCGGMFVAKITKIQ